MFRDDDEAAEVRRDIVARELAEAEPPHAALVQRVRAARLRALGRGGGVGVVIGAILVGAMFLGQTLPPDDPGVVQLTIDAAPLPPPPALAADAPRAELESRCANAEGEACARLAAIAGDPTGAYRLYRRACLTRHHAACLAVSRILIATQPDVAILLAAEQCIVFGQEDACAWMKQTCAEHPEEACKVRP